MSVIHIKIKIRNPTCFGHSIRPSLGVHSACAFYYYQCACNISYAYVAVCYLCAYLCGVLARMGKHTAYTDTQVTHSATYAYEILHAHW
jgi:hypothetical protein